MTNSIKDKIQNDVVMKEFWRDKEHFADIVNAVVFDGECVVIPDELQEADTDVSGSIIVDEYKETLKRIRDVVKKYYYGVEFNIIGLEVQENVHLAMPLRTLVYDALGYLKEYNIISLVNEKQGYKGKERKEFDKIFKEYKGKDVSAEFIEMIGKITGTKELIRLADNGRKGKVVNMEMCNAMKEFLEGGRREGRIEGQREGRIEGQDKARLDSIRTLMKKLNQTAEEAMDTLDIADEDKVRYRKMLGL